MSEETNGTQDGRGPRERITPELMEKLDLLWKSPSVRAEEVWETLQEGWNISHDEPLPEFDVLCFALEFAGRMAVTIGDESFLEVTRAALKWLYIVHYNHPSTLHGKPDAIQHIEESGAAEHEVPGGDGQQTSDN